MKETPRDSHINSQKSHTEDREKNASIIVDNEGDYNPSCDKKNTKFIYSPEEKRLLRKINITTVPFICSIAFLQYIDKIILNFSTVIGLFDDTGIDGNQFSWVASIFFFGYLLFQIPNQYLMQKFPISKYLGTFLILWGVNLGCTALASNFSQLLALRFLQGFFEAAAYPCIQILYSTIYRRQEQVVLFGIMLITNDVGFAFGGLVGYGFLNLDGAYGLRGWKWCMIILGCVTVGMGIATFFFLPDTPKSRWFRLTHEQSTIVDDRLRDNQLVPNKVVNFNHIWESLKEARLYCYFLICILINLEHGCLSIFSTMIIKTMGFSDMAAILLNIPLAFASILTTATAIYFSHRYNENGYVGAVACIVGLLGVLLLTVLPTGGVQLIGLYLTSIGGAYTIGLTMISNNVCGYTKKIFYNGTYITAYCLGCFLGPLMMRENEAPRYLSGMIGYIVGMLIAAVLFLYLRWSYARDNQYRLRLKAENKLIEAPSSLPSFVKNQEQQQTIAEKDTTDRQNLHFLYRP